MIYNVNFNLENEVRRANNEAALKDAILDNKLGRYRHAEN